MVEPVRHRQTKGAATDMFYLTPPGHIPTTREARRWSIVNLSIFFPNKCRAPMNVRAMVRCVSP